MKISAEDLLKILKNINKNGDVSEIQHILIEEDLGLNSFAVDYSDVKIKLAFLAIRYGASVEKVAPYLDWREFEKFCSKILEAHFFHVYRNLRFKSNTHWFEIDLLGLKKPYILCLDAKRWSLRPGKSYGIKKSALNQLERCRYLSQEIIKFKTRLGIRDWEKILIIPGIITLYEEAVKIFEKVPVIPIFKFNSFIEEFDGYLDMIQVIEVKNSK